MANIGLIAMCKAATSVPYTIAVHGADGNLATPTAITCTHETPAGVFGAETAPAVKNSTTGWYGGSIDTTGYATGVHHFEVAYTVGGISRTETFCVQIVASDIDDAGAALTFIQQWILNKLVRTDNGDGTVTYVLYADNSTTPLKTWTFTTATGSRAKAS
jgi:hypothetical protein